MDRSDLDRMPVAIIGMGCRFPQADGPEEFWDLLLGNVDAVVPVPLERYDPADHYDPSPETRGKTVSRHGGFLNDAFSFDARFFGIAPVEAESMDPQQRLLLHVVWEALEDSGIVPSSLAGTRTGVFVGQATAEYAETTQSLTSSAVHGIAGGRIRAVTAGRISYALDLHGPSIVLDSACSSSLVALHAARQSLLTGESDVAIAGGVNLILSAQDAIAYSQGGMLSPRGRCRFGDSSADGFVRSEGVGAVVLKPLSDAVRDGNPVLALLLGTTVTNDGKGSGLLLRPSVDGQIEMLRQACRSAGIAPWQLDYVEAHGTGTPVGDEVELRALAAATAPGRPADRPLATGSVKTNIGHAEAAAGMAGLIKAVLIARHGVIPASLHLDDPHPLLGETSSVRMVTANQPLDAAGGQALIGISSFGLSGTNAHAVIGQYPGPADPADRGREGDGTRREVGTQEEDRASEQERGTPHLLVLTARSATALRRSALAHADHLGPGGGGRRFALRDICGTTATRRQAHAHRLWVVGVSHDDLAGKLRKLAAGEPVPDGGTTVAGTGTGRRTVFVFPGQGSQWVGMGKGLLAGSAAFRKTMEACDQAIRAELGWSVIELVNGDEPRFPTDVDRVQPALWAMEVALAAALREVGVVPDACVGHSMGEVAAAHVTGSLSLDDAAAVICRRSRIMRRAAGKGAMLAVELSVPEAVQAIAPYAGSVCVAAENAPRSTVLAGSRTALAEIEDTLSRRDVLCRLVKVEVASHSRDMEPLRGELLARLRQLRPVPATVPLLSTVRGTPVVGDELGAAYWADNLRRPVRFCDTVHRAAEEADSLFVEVSPHPLLVNAVEETISARGLSGAAVPTLRRDHAEPADLARAVGRIFAAGGRVDWSRWFGGPVPPVPLPAYAWDAVSYRHPARQHSVGEAHVEELDLAGLGADGWGEGIRVRGNAVVPPVVHLAAVLRTAQELPAPRGHVLEEVELHGGPLHLDTASAIRLRVTLTPSPGRNGRAARVEVVRPGLPSGGSAVCLTGVLREAGEAGPRAAPKAVDAMLGQCRRYLSADDFHRLAAGRGIEIGEEFRAVEQLWLTTGKAVARMRRPAAPHPAAWEVGLQPLLAAWSSSARFGSGGDSFCPVGFRSVRLHGELPERFWSLACFRPERGSRTAEADVLLLGPDGTVLAEFTGIGLRRVPVRPAPGPPSPGPLVSQLFGSLMASVDTAARRSGEPLLSGTRGLIGRLVASAAVRPVPLPPVSPVSPAVPAAAPARQRAEDGSDGDAFLAHAAAVLGLAAGDIDLEQPLHAHGLDSFMAVRLKQHLRNECGIDVTAGRLLATDVSVRSIIGSLTRQECQA